MIALANGEARWWQTFTPQAASQALQENTDVCTLPHKETI